MKAKGLFFVGILSVLFALLLISFISAMITSITLTAPANNAWTSSLSPNFTFRAVSNSDPTFTCSLIVDGVNRATNGSTANNTLTTLVSMLVLPPGMHRWNITCTDTLGILTSETRTLYTDSEAPNITLVWPADGYEDSSREVDFKFKVTDNLDSQLECKLYIDGDEEENGNVNNNTQVTWTLSNLTRDEHDWQVKCEDNAENEGSSETRNFNITGGTQYCDDGEQGDGLAITLESPDSGDELYAGENVSIRVNVENTYTDDLDVVIEVELYDIDEDDSVVSTDYETTIQEDDENTYTLYLKIPTDVDVDDDYVVNAKVYEDGNENEQCKEDGIDVTLEQKVHNIVITSFSLSPTLVQCGQTFNANLKIENDGSNDEDIRVGVKNSDLKVDFSKDFSLNSGNDYSETINLVVPTNASEKDYSIVLTVYYNDYEDTVSDTETLEVKGNCFVETKDVSFSLQQLSEAFNGQEFAVKVLVTNTGNVPITYTINVSDYGSWATLSRIDPTSLSLDGGSSGFAYVYLMPLENATGMSTFKVKVSFGSVTREQAMTVNVRRQTTPAAWFDQIIFELKRNWQYILTDVVLVAAVVVLAILLIRQKIKTSKFMGEEPSQITVRTINEKDFSRARKKR